MRVSLHGVGMSFGDRRVLANLGLQVEASTSMAIVGPSGSGKSTLLGILSGQLHPTHGSREIDPPDLRCAWIVQSSPLLHRRTALDNVALGAVAVGHDRLEAEWRARRSMDVLGIASLAGQPAHVLSGGERQRLVVARGLAAEAHLLLADEPTAALDRANRALVCVALTAAARAGCAVVVATHDPVVAASCGRVLDLAQPTGLADLDGRALLTTPRRLRRMEPRAWPVSGTGD